VRPCDLLVIWRTPETQRAQLPSFREQQPQKFLAEIQNMLEFLCRDFFDWVKIFLSFQEAVNPVPKEAT
jgi:hypothetical protein